MGLNLKIVGSTHQMFKKVNKNILSLSGENLFKITFYTTKSEPLVTYN